MKLSKFAMLVYLILVPVLLTAEETGTIVGNVVDKDENPFAGVRVILLKNHQPTDYWAFTNEEGYYAITDVPIGIYRLRCSKGDEFSLVSCCAGINPNKTLRYRTIHLRPLRVIHQRPINVIESPPSLMWGDYITEGITVTGEEIEHMPVDNIEQVLENLVPGAVSTSP
jgi:hypothetical protein